MFTPIINFSARTLPDDVERRAARAVHGCHGDVRKLGVVVHHEGGVAAGVPVVNRARTPGAT